jgi:hypothetical protein
MTRDPVLGAPKWITLAYIEPQHMPDIFSKNLSFAPF